MKKILILTIFLIITSSLVAQKGNDNSSRDEINIATLSKTIKEYEKLVLKNPENPEYLMTLGYCYTLSPNLAYKSIDVLTKSVNIYALKKKDANFIDASFLLGIAYRKNYEFDKSIAIFNDIIINKEYKDYKSIDIIERELAFSKNAKIFYKSSDLLIVKSLDSLVNTEYSEHSPSYLENSNRLVFTTKKTGKLNYKKGSDGQPIEKTYVANWNNSNIDSVRPFFPNSKLKNDNANCWISSTEDYMLIYKQENIYIIKKQDDKWTDPKAFKEINSAYTESDVCMNEEQNIVIFSSDRPGGYGKLDLYMSIKDEKGRWTKPVNLGKNINTSNNENGPFLHNNKTLYFSSEGHNSMGGYDVFSSELVDNKDFSKTKNLGSPINSIGDDIFYFTTKNRHLAFFTSDRIGSKGTYDIYMIDYTDSSLVYLNIKGNAIKENNKNDDIFVETFKISNKLKEANTTTNQEGDYTVNVHRGSNYFLTVKSDGYFFESLSFSAPFNDFKEKQLPNIKLTEVILGQVNKQYSITYRDEISEINNETELFLTNLVEFLKKYPNLKIDLSSSDKINVKVTNNRIQNIVDYLKENGISDELVSTNLMNSKLANDELLVTIMDVNIHQVAFQSKIDEDYDNNVVVNTGNSENGTYTIQVAAFRNRKTAKNRFFKALNNNVAEIKCKDRLWHYTYGKYQYKSEAEDALIHIQRKGYADAFVREVQWYKDNK